MYRLTIQKEAAEDLRTMIAQGGEAKKDAQRIAAFLQELKSRQDWLAELLTRKFRNDEFNVDKFVEYWDAGLDLWRLALYEFDFTRQKQWQMPYRVLYAYDIPVATFRILGIVPRHFDYKPEHEFTKRICRTYDELDLPKHRASSSAYRGSNKRH